MREITAIGLEPRQEMTLITEEGEEVKLILTFYPTLEKWFFGFEYKEIKLYNMALVQGINLLRQFKNIIPFGFSSESDNVYLDAYKLDDFQTGRCKLFLLNSSEVELIENEFYA